MDMNDYLNKKFSIVCNPQQKQAMEHVKGPAIVLAVAGSGKTTTLVSRTANLILNHGINPEEIYTMTFSKASARDMEQRFRELFGKEIQGRPNFSTIHSFAFRIVKFVFQQKKRRLSILEEESKNPKEKTKTAVLGALFQKYNGEYPTEEKIENLVTKLSFVKNRMIPYDQLKDHETVGDIPNFEKIYKDYETYKKQREVIDYDDMLVLALKILQNSMDLLQRCRRIYPFIQVDEFQDTSPLQFEIIKTLAFPKNNLFVVGDDDQGIYSWRGTDPKIMLDFPEIYREAKVYFMEENFRSTPELVALANGLIEKNKERYHKKSFTKNPSDPGIIQKVYRDEKGQLEGILQELRGEKNPESAAILFRNNVSAIPLIKALHKEGMPFYIRDYRNKFFNHWVIQDLKAFMAVAVDPGDLTAFNRIYYKNDAYLSKKMMLYTEEVLRKRKNMTNIFDAMLTYPGIKRYQSQRIEKIQRGLKALGRKKGEEIVTFIEEDLGYGQFLERKSDHSGASMENGKGILDTVRALCEDLESITDFEEIIEGFKEVLEQGKRNFGKGVTLTTVHSAKGLEFPKVYVMDLMDEVFPSAGSLKKSDEQGENALLEEERRLFYVALTRAKSRLNLLTMEKRYGAPVKPSRFLQEIKGDIRNRSWKNQWKDRLFQRDEKESDKSNGNPLKTVNREIFHEKFGKGRIIKIHDEDRITVRFQQGGEKILHLQYLMDKDLVRF
ncbi:ATP-dependent helicase [Isachenkonia alkalipeptolytica]|uniref:DNA 3'-5' helicase n=1 Tax=Isachenkonia alkalipeptolytica TaxID=2565777 RepID=A0AA43XIJ7_9CLOT|nr:ATP-dependent helicase [Isachenkonia alkalipeptolytica]NBG86989.1 ATP-dependent helicase [Isachenkonia alkalipeptolytica]